VLATFLIRWENGILSAMDFAYFVADDESSQHSGSGWAKRGAIRACKRSNFWVDRTTLVTVVLVSCAMVGE